MKMFFVSKSDKNRLDYIKSAIDEIKPSNTYILAEKDRHHVYSCIKAIKLPLKDLNKAENWIAFVNTVNNDSLLIIDNVLKFVFFGDGKKSYLKAISQRIKNIIVTDVVPFYTEPHEIFYPFWFLGKEILGYNSYNTFKANHFEEKEDGKIDTAHSFSVLKNKIKDYYLQDYDNYFNNVSFFEFEMTEYEKHNYNEVKIKSTESFSNPVKLYTEVSEAINLIDSRYNAAIKILSVLDNVVIVNNSSSYQIRHKKKLGDYRFLTFHDQLDCFNKYENILFLQLPVIKPYNIFYILCADINCIQLKLIDNNLENHFHNKIYNNELRNKFDAYFYNTNLQAAH